MPHFLNIEHWERKDHYFFFKDFDDPFFTLCANVDITQTLAYVKDHQSSFFLASLYLSTIAANKIKEFKYRIREDKVIVHERVHPSSTVFKENKTFGFCYFEYNDTFSKFSQSAEKIIKLNQQNQAPLTSYREKDAVIYYTVIPWTRFTNLTHPKQHIKKDSIPKIGFGKYYEENRRLQMPVSVQVNHALLDGFHISEFLNSFQELLNHPEEALAA